VVQMDCITKYQTFQYSQKASQDVTVFTISQVAENMRIKETYGLDCNLKRVFIKEEV